MGRAGGERGPGGVSLALEMSASLSELYSTGRQGRVVGERSDRRLTRVKLPPSWASHPDALDETVVHDPGGRPWLVCTSDRYYDQRLAPPSSDGEDVPVEPALGAAAPAGRYETQVFYTARAGIRGFPTGHGQRFSCRQEALVGHRRWCLHVRSGEVEPDRVPDDPLEWPPT